MPDAEAYDSILFESFPSPERHIDRLYVMAVLAGLVPVPPSRARILEIGCSTALNLIPQAEHYRDSHFLGVDLSSSQIARGKEAMRALGLTNIELREQDITTLADESACYDYVICHGLYSWVTEEMRAALIHKISELIAPQGVVYLSFNTQRAWSRRMPVRRIVLHYDEVNSSMELRIRAARALLGNIEELVGKLPGDSGEAYRAEIRRTLTESDAILAHEYLNHSLKAFTVSEIEHTARSVGLSYIGDARQRRNSERYFLQLESGAIKQLLEKSSRAEREDICDALEGRSFRAALLTKGELPEEFSWSADLLRKLMVSSPLVPVDIGHANAAPTFMMGNGAAVEIAEPPVASMLEKLHQAWPRPLPLIDFPAVCESVPSGGLFERLVWNQMIDLSHSDFSCLTKAGLRPRVSAYARYQARLGGIVPTLRHEQCDVNAFERLVLTCLDGDHTRDQLIDFMVQAIDSGRLRVQEGSGVTMSRDFIGEQIDATLLEFSERGMFHE